MPLSSTVSHDVQQLKTKKYSNRQTDRQTARQKWRKQEGLRMKNRKG